MLACEILNYSIYKILACKTIILIINNIYITLLFITYDPSHHW
jgi:hypothetical protein